VITKQLFPALVFAALASSGGNLAGQAAGRSCESLMALELPNTAITLAEAVPAGGFTRGATGRSNAEQAVRNGVPFCRVAATLKPSPDSDIKIEVWLPASGWNGKFQAVGNGGWAGIISYPAMNEALARGYATSSTDTGHTGDGGSFVLGHPEKFVDYAWRSEHEMTVRAKAIIEAFYGAQPRRAYWNGCSTGGRQGLIEAQRFPADYDGIIAGASANPRSALNASSLAVYQSVRRDPAATIPPAKYPLIHAAVLDACDALDGVKDRVLEDPTRCRFDPRVLACKGDETPTCLTPPQINAVTTILSAVKTRAGVEVFPAREPGSELGWGFFNVAEAPPLIADTFRYLVYKDSNWDWRTFDLDRDLAKAAGSSEITQADAKADLRAFAERGGKLLMYHGWSDPLVAPRSSVNYYRSVRTTMGGSAQSGGWIRLFMVPGMGHCRGGDGPNSFDVVRALEQWVENGTAPERIIVSRVIDGQVDRTRPLCPYPQAAVYTGTGSTDEASNFVCKAPNIVQR
jgi:Tannase and feruloyl esterase